MTAKRHEAIEVLQRKLGEISDEFAREMRPVQQDHDAALAEFERLRNEGAPRNPELESRMMGLGAQIRALAEKNAEGLKPIEDELHTLMHDPEIDEAEKRVDKITDEAFSRALKSSQRTGIVADVNVTVRRWRKLWYVLEVGFPSVVGLVAIFIPIWKF